MNKFRYYPKKASKPLNCSSGTKQCGGACVDKDYTCTGDREKQSHIMVSGVKKELSNLEQGQEPGPLVNKSLASLLVHDKTLGQKLPPEFTDAVASYKTIDDRVKKAYIDSATYPKWNSNKGSDLKVSLNKEDPGFQTKIKTRAVALDVKPTIVNGQVPPETPFFSTVKGKTIIKLLGATAVVGAGAALAAYSLKQAKIDKPVTLTLEDDINKSFTKDPVKTEAAEIVTESARRAGVVTDKQAKDLTTQASNSPYTSQTVYEEYADVYKSAIALEKDRRKYGHQNFSLRQNEDYEANWGVPAAAVLGKAVATPNSRLGRAESALEARVREISKGATDDQLEYNISKAKAMAQNKDLLMASRNKNQIFDSETKTWSPRTYVNAKDSNDPDYSKSQDVLIQRQKIKDLEKSYQDPFGSSIEQNSFQQDGTFTRGDRNKGNVPLVNIDDIDQRHHDAFVYDQTRERTASERWESINKGDGSGKTVLKDLWIDSEIVKDLTDGKVNESETIVYGMIGQRTAAAGKVREVINASNVDIESLRAEKYKLMSNEISAGRDPFPKKPKYIPESENKSKTDNVKDRFGALGSVPASQNPNLIPERYKDESPFTMSIKQKTDWGELGLKQDSYIDSQVFRDATGSNSYSKAVISVDTDISAAANEYVGKELKSIYDDKTLRIKREQKRKEIEKSINNGLPTLPDYISQVSTVVSGQQDKDFFDEEKQHDGSIGTVENVDGVNASNGGAKQRKAAEIAQNKLNIFKDIGDSPKYKKTSVGDNKSIRDRKGNIFATNGTDFFVNGRKQEYVFVDSNGVERRRTVNDILERMFRQFQFSENFSTQNMEIQAVLEIKDNTVIFETINNGIVAATYDYYQDVFLYVGL